MIAPGPIVEVAMTSCRNLPGLFALGLLALVLGVALLLAGITQD